MGTSIGIDEIDDIERMSEVMRCRGLSLGGLQTLDQMKQRAKKALRISEKVRMKHLWLRIDSNSRYTDIAILSQNYQEPMALNTGPTVKRNAEVIGRNYSNSKLNQWTLKTLLVVD